MSAEWKIAVSNESNISLDDVKFIFYQAEKRLESTIKNSDNVSTKTLSIVAALLAIITGCCAYIISNWVSLEKMNNKSITASIAVVYAILIGGYMIKNVLPAAYHSMGSMPKDLFLDRFFTSDFNEERRTIHLYMNEIEDYNKRIKINWENNNDRWGRYTGSVIALFIMPFILTIFFLLLEKFNP